MREVTVTCRWCGILLLRELTVRVDGAERVCRDRVACTRRHDKPRWGRPHRSVTRLTAAGERVADLLAARQ